MRRAPFALLVLAAAFLTSASPPPVPGRVAPPAVDFGQPEWVYDGDTACTGAAKRWTPQRICASGADIVLVSDGDHAFLPARYPIRAFDTSACFGLEVTGATPRPENTAAYIARVKAECTAQGKPAPKFLLTPRLDVVQRGALNYDPLSPDSPATLGAFDPAWILRRDPALTTFDQLLAFFAGDSGSYCTAFGRCYYSPCRGPRTVAYEAPDEWGSPKDDGGCDQASEEGGHLLPELLERLEPGLSTRAVYYLGRITGAAGFATNVKARIDDPDYQDWIAEAVRLRVQAVGADGIVYLHKIEQHRPQGAEAWGTQHRYWLGSVVPEYSAPPFVGAIDTVEELNLTGDTLWSHQPEGGWGYSAYITGWNALAKKIDAKGIDFAVVSNAKPFDGCSQLDASWGHASCDDDFDDPTTGGVNEGSMIREVIALARWPSIDLSGYNRPPPQGFGSSSAWAKPKEFASWLDSEAPAVERVYFFQATSPRAVAPIGSTDALEPPPPAPANGRPIANPGNDVLAEAGADVALSAAASADPGGSVASRLWEIVGGDGPGEPCDSATLTSASAVSTTLQGASGVGFCHVRLTVTDNGGATDSDTVRVRFVSATLTPSAASGTVPFSPTFVFDIEHGAAPLDFGVFQLGLDTGGAIVASSQTSAGEVCGSGHRCYTYSGFTYATPDADLDPFVEYVVEGQVVLSATTAITANAPSAPVIQQVSVTPPSGVDPFDPLIGVVSAGGTGTLTVLADCDNSGGACPTSGSGAFETTLGTGTSVSSAACPAFTTAGANTFRVCVRDSAGTPQVTTASAQLVVEPQTLFGALSLDVADCPAPCDGRDVSILLSGTCPGIGAGAGVSVVGNCDNGGGSSDFSVAGSTANPIQFADACGGYTTGGKTVSATLSCGTANDFDAIAQLAVDAPFSISPVLFPTSCQPPCSVVVGAACGGAPEPVDNVTVDCEDDGTFESSGSALLDDCTEDPSAPPLATCFYSSTGTKTVAICGDTDSHDCGTATVTVNPAPASPILAVSPTSLAHTIVTGENAPADTLLITNQGGGTLAWTITETPAAAWVSASPLTGTTTTETDSVPVSYATTGLPDGVYTTTLRVVNDAAPSSPVLVPVTITVNNPENEIATCGTGIPTWSDHASIGSFSGGETKITYTSVNNGAQIVIHLAGDQTGNCFHYANGDVGCVAPVTINRMTPDHSGTCEGAARGTSGCLNGWMRNPNHDGNYALDSRMTASASHGWAASQLGVGGDPDLPVTISAPATILKAFSYPTSQTTDTGWDGTKTLCTATQPCAKYLAVFSVVAVRPALPAGTFRPPIYGTTKPPSRTVAAIDWGKLGRISISGNGLSMTNAPSFTAVRKRFLEAQVDISDHFDQRMMHATGNFDWAGYHGGLSADASAAISRFTLSDFDPTNRTHCEAVVGMLQWGLDLWWQHERGWAFNDHSHGRQFVYAFAANLLKDPSMKAKFESVAGFGAEEIDRYYFGQGAGKHLWGHTCTPIQFWQRHWNKSLTPKDCGDPHGGYVDGHDEYWECCNFQQDALAIIAFEHLGIRDFYDSAGLMEGWFEANYRRYTSGVEKRPDPCAPYDGVQGNYGVTFGPPGGSATPGCEVTRTCACITGSHPPDRDINGLADGARVNSGIAQPGDHWPAWRSAYKAIWACARAGTCVLTP